MQIDLISILKFKTNSDRYFGFTLKELQEHFGKNDEEDSLLEGIKFHMMLSYFYEQYLLIKEISSILTADKILFGKLMNAKKFLIIYYLNRLENLYLMSAVYKIGKTFE